MFDLIQKTALDWQPLLHKALATMDENYLNQLTFSQNYLPKYTDIFAAFQQPLENTEFILLGESPYPRACSANGYAFWDAAVASLWSEKGLSKEVNRATSFRNLIKMLLIARGDLDKDLSQEAIARLDKTRYCQTATDFFSGLLKKGFLLLNATLVYDDAHFNQHTKAWRPFMNTLFNELAKTKPDISLILFGRIAAQFSDQRVFPALISEHPYNISFITNPHVLSFFRPLDLLIKNE